MKKAKFSPPMIALAVITLTLSSYGLYGLAHDFGHVPAFLALMSVAGYDLFAVQAGKHALDLARDGDSAGIWHLAVFGAAALSAGLQYAHSQLAGEPIAVGVLKAGFPIATVALFDGTLRRAYRLNGRRTGRVAEPRGTFEILQWLVFPRATWRAFKLGVVDRELGSDALFKMGLVSTATTDPEYKPKKRKVLQLNYGAIIPGMQQLTTGLESGESPEPSGELPDRRPDTRSIAELVKTFAQVRTTPEGPDAAAIIADVRGVHPDAREDTIRRAIRNLPDDPEQDRLRSV